MINYQAKDTQKSLKEPTTQTNTSGLNILLNSARMILKPFNIPEPLRKQRSISMSVINRHII